MKKIILTGSNGYIGKETKHILKKQYNVDEIDIENGDDVKNISYLKEKIKNADCVVHLAAYKDISESLIRKKKYYYNNIVSTLVPAILCRIYNKPMIFSSSAAVYNADNPYAKSKKIGEWLVKIFVRKYVILRYFNIGGATSKTNDNKSHNLFTMINKYTVINIWNEHSTRDYTHVKDIAKANLLAVNYILENNKSLLTDIFSGNRYTVEQILEIYSLNGHEIKKRFYALKDPEIFSKKDQRKILGWSANYSIQDIIKSELKYTK